MCRDLLAGLSFPCIVSFGMWPDKTYSLWFYEIAHRCRFFRCMTFVLVCQCHLSLNTTDSHAAQLRHDIRYVVSYNT